MSGSEQDFSESSNLESPQSQGSPYSSPSQQVPHLVNVFSGITCADDASLHSDGNKPYLRLVEQPQNYFRFRYKSEMCGTHGCILGKSASTSKNRTHPTVELMNYTGKALIRVRLTQGDKDDEHPHKLLEDEQEDRDVSTIVPQQGSYRVGFAGMGIIHTAKKDVAGLFFKKYMEEYKNKVSTKELRAHCENRAKTINLNIVRLRFSAHDIVTDKEICPRVFSDPIHNIKSAATNDLKICRISKYTGKPKGGEDVFILVEKVNKKNIIIRFYEQNDLGEIVWSANANFLQSDVHHQYAIVFRTPPYSDPNITHNVKVWIELLRPSDGRTSEPKEFVYKADQVSQHGHKRRRLQSSLSSLESCSGGSEKSQNCVPATVEMIDQRDNDELNQPLYQINIPQLPAQPRTTTSNDLAEALIMSTGVSYQPSAPVPTGPLMGQGHMPEMPPVISLNSAELERLINHDTQLPSEEKKRFIDMDWTEYMQSFGESLPDKTQTSMDFLRTSMQLVTDSGNTKAIKEEPVSPTRSTSGHEQKSNTGDKSKFSGDGYNAHYTADDGNEVKKLVTEICEIFKNKTSLKKQVVRNKLERLFEMRLSNGDTFLHMALSSNQPSLEYMIKLIHSMRVTHLLNYTNDQQQSILHLAVLHNMPKIVSLLISKGCDPMIADVEGNTAIHNAVMYHVSCLKPLLDAIKQHNVPCDLDAYNNDRQTALHLAAVYNCSESVSLLSRAGAGDARDGAGRGALHLAAYDGHAAVLRALLQLPQCEVDAVDGVGNTVLQIICNKQDIDQEKLEIVKLLLDKKADPLKREGGAESAWQLSGGRAALRAVLAPHVPSAALQLDVKSEPDDDFDSADEGEAIECGLRELPLYIGEVSSRLDATGAWAELAKRLHVEAMFALYNSTSSPTRTLLTHVKESGDNISSKSLALILQDMGQDEAAAIIRRHIE